MRNIYIPLVKKVVYRDSVLVERILPKEGVINVKVGDKVDPSDKLGTCRVIYDVVKLGKKFRTIKKVNGSVYQEGELVGYVGKEKFEAPFSGLLSKDKNEYAFVSEERDYWLLPGVWGEVIDIVENRSVLLKTQTLDLHLPFGTQDYCAGELVVFPNPSEILSEHYFGNYVKSAMGKIIYVGHVLTINLIQKANEIGVGALLCGSASKEVFDYAVKNKICLGILNGLGSAETPEYIFNLMNQITNRYVFFQGEKNILRIPVPVENEFYSFAQPKPLWSLVKKDLVVQVLVAEHFCKIGKVDRVTKSGIFVELLNDGEVIQIMPPNLIAIE